MKKVFISHPLTGDMEGNREKVDKICEYIVGQGLLPMEDMERKKDIRLQVRSIQK